MLNYSQNITEFGQHDINRITTKVSPDRTPKIPEKLFYLVQFNDNDGFAILAANKKLPNAILCYSEKGAINKESFSEAYSALTLNRHDSVFNKESLFVPALLLSSAIKDLSSESNPQETYTPETKTTPTVEEKYGPLVNVKWTQWAPMNNYYDEKPVGCCTIAVAQIVVTNRQAPGMMFDGKICSWDDLESVYHYSPATGLTNGSIDAQDQSAHLIKMIMEPNFLDGTGASNSIKKVKRTMERFHYKNITRYWGFNDKAVNKANECLRSGRPVYMEGLNKGIGNGGHCWVIDGYWNRDEEGTIKTYHHINWGWKGAWDGYYSTHCFDVDQRNDIDSDYDPGTTNSSVQNTNITWDVSCITYSL